MRALSETRLEGYYGLAARIASGLKLVEGFACHLQHLLALKKPFSTLEENCELGFASIQTFL